MNLLLRTDTDSGGAVKERGSCLSSGKVNDE